MVPGGMAVKFSVGYAEEDVRADVEIAISPASTFGYEFQSSCSPLYDHLIREQIVKVASEFGSPPLFLKCADSGALPFTWLARLTAAFCIGLGIPIPPVVSDKRYGFHGLRRTRLYVPSNTPKLIPNAPLFQADAVILDLEESVHVGRKTEALALAGAASESVDWTGMELMVRVNGGEQGRVDLLTLARSSVGTFILPKVDSPDNVLEVCELLDEAESDAKIIPLVESALGVENAYEIAACSSRISAISLGLEDYVADIGAIRTIDQSESFFARSRVLNAARAAGIMPLASVFPEFKNQSQVTEYARRARMDGYEGIGCIHPSQIDSVHLGFAADELELDRARKIVKAYEQASESGTGVVGVEGSMADLPTYRRAKRLLKISGLGGIE